MWTKNLDRKPEKLFSEADPWISRLDLSLGMPLPGIEAQKKMISNYQKSLIQYFNDNVKLRDAAVLIILFKENERIKTLLIERMPDPGPHSGQIAFPGGKKEETDSDLTDTAIREADEEIGVKVDRINVLGHLTNVEIPVSGFSVMPVVSFVNEITVFKRCPTEVNSILKVDLVNLLDSRTTKVINIRGSEVEVPCYVIDNHIVWGATAMVLSEFEEILKRVDLFF